MVMVSVPIAAPHFIGATNCTYVSLRGKERVPLISGNAVLPLQMVEASMLFAAKPKTTTVVITKLGLRI